MNDLYQEMIIEHARKPRNQGKLEEATHHSKGHNPLCGDEIELSLIVEGGVIRDVKFEGVGCAISQASASLMTEEILGKPVVDVLHLFESFHARMTQPNPDDSEDLGSLEAIVPVREYPMRVKCATMCWHALRDALERSHA